MLFSPLKLGSLTLRNRVAMAPMTREAARDGVPTDEMAAYYARRAEGGVGLVITEGTPPDAAGSFGSTVPRFHGEDALEGWRRVADAVHRHGAAIFPQLWHVGAFSPSMIGMRDSLAPELTRLSPSLLAAPGRPFGQATTTGKDDATPAAVAHAAHPARCLRVHIVRIPGPAGCSPPS